MACLRWCTLHYRMACKSRENSSQTVVKASQRHDSAKPKCARTEACGVKDNSRRALVYMYACACGDRRDHNVHPAYQRNSTP